ncbi:MAG: hypothetical protein ABIY52_13450 [Gemmatimonadaceae bacterium]
MRWRRFVLAVFTLPVLALQVEGQVAGRVRPGSARPNRRLQQQDPGAPPAARRQQLEQQVRRTFWRAAKQRIGFTDEQMLRLERTTQRFDARRRELGQQERSQRVALREQMVADSSANQGAVASVLDQLHDIQRKRLDLQEEEQRDLASFMTPLQRARFGAMQEQVRRRMQELVRARPDSVRQSLPPE